MKFYLTILILLLTKTSQSQGSWDIGYVLVDSLNDTHIGKVFKLDFKTKTNYSKSDSNRRIRSYVGTKDTANVKIDTSLFRLAEIRRIFVDHGSYDEQFLECLNCPNITLRIYDAKILEINDRRVLFMIEAVINRRTSIEPEKFFKKVSIEKSDLDGVMYKL